jgi:hypothetical protein
MSKYNIRADLRRFDASIIYFEGAREDSDLLKLVI